MEFNKNPTKNSLELLELIKHTDESQIITRFKAVNRSRYTHKKKNKITKKEKVNALASAKTPKKQKDEE